MDTTKTCDGCQSFMSKCFNIGTPENKGEKFNLEGCGQMMKQFFPAKDGKFDSESMKSMIEQCCGGMSKR